MCLNASVQARLRRLVVMGGLVLAAGGCGGGANETGTVVEASKEHARRNQEMVNYMKNNPQSQGSGKRRQQMEFMQGQAKNR